MMKIPKQEYATGAEVGLDSNARKNRTGTMMESIVEPFIASAASKQGGVYMAQATKAKIKAEWHIDIAVDKTDRRIDFAVQIANRLYFIETNFYGGGGSKLKSTAGEYKDVSAFFAEHGHTDTENQKYKSEFIWITDGAGWHSAKAPLREFFNRSPALLNLQCLQDGALERIIK
ncbi:MAG: DpnII family type II restriction endonuclease [Gallionella sp.]|nr:DpnII family type II restriction endonuclease [Gallionella sp.]